ERGGRVLLPPARRPAGPGADGRRRTRPRCRERRSMPAASTAIGSSSAGRPSVRVDDADEGGDEIVVGCYQVEVDAGPACRVTNGLFPFVAGVAEAASELGIARVDEQLITGLGVLDDDESGVRQIELATISQPDGDD